MPLVPISLNVIGPKAKGRSPNLKGLLPAGHSHRLNPAAEPILHQRAHTLGKVFAIGLLDVQPDGSMGLWLGLVVESEA